jgi:hypothetical protein
LCVGAKKLKSLEDVDGAYSQSANKLGLRHPLKPGPGVQKFQEQAVVDVLSRQKDRRLPKSFDTAVGCAMFNISQGLPEETNGVDNRCFLSPGSPRLLHFSLEPPSLDGADTQRCSLRDVLIAGPRSDVFDEGSKDVVDLRLSVILSGHSFLSPS